MSNAQFAIDYAYRTAIAGAGSNPADLVARAEIIHAFLIRADRTERPTCACSPTERVVAASKGSR